MPSKDKNHRWPLNRSVMFLLVIQLIMFAGVGPPAAVPQAPVCDSAILLQAESSFRKRNESLKSRRQSEIDVKRAIESCASKRARLERRLAQEEIAMTNMQIALFYLHARGPGLKGAISRLKAVDENYPHFSQIDRVLFMLGDLSDQDGNANDAANYFRRVIESYPRSLYAPHARKRLAEVTANGET